jgi:hypothetical protein
LPGPCQARFPFFDLRAGRLDKNSSNFGADKPEGYVRMRFEYSKIFAVERFPLKKMKLGFAMTPKDEMIATADETEWIE